MKGKYVEKVRGYIRKTPVANVSSISALLPNRKYAYTLINHLLKRMEIRRITRGYYTVYEEPSLIVYCLKPAYLGLQDAMSFHNLWEQETNPIVITARRVRTGVREVLGQNVWVRRISPKYLFGYEYFISGEFLLPVSDVEKTLIDIIYFDELKESMIKRFRGKINERKIEEYLKKYESNFRDKVLEILRSI
jgi:predicted transcriptional regulator of viral defense system